jgi:hypothetical protein
MGRRLSDLYAEVKRIAESASMTRYPRPEDRRQEDRDWLERDMFGRFSRHYMERGKIFELTRGDYETVLFEVFNALTSRMAWDIEVRQRIPGEDSRRQAFAIQADMMARLKPEWAARIKASHEAVLARHPFVDDQ